MSTVAQSFGGWEKFDMSILPTEVLESLVSAAKTELRKRTRGSFRGVDHRRVKLPTGKRKRSTLADLLEQDWSRLFNAGDEERKYYVYAHVRPPDRLNKHAREYVKKLPLGIDGMPFYIGKGCGGRAYDLNRNQAHGAELRSLLATGVGPGSIVTIIKDRMTEREALEMESKLIFFFGTKFEIGRGGVLVNLDLPPRPS